MLKGKRFVVSVSVVNTREFGTFAALAARLRRFAGVSMSVSQLSRKTTEDIPDGGSPWHEYTANLPVLTKKFFPHPKEEPFLNMDYVHKNVALLRGCARILRKHKLGAAFSTHDPFYMPEAFFAEHPHLRGARLDHPRRTRQEAFGICRDCAEGQEMLAYSMARLMKEVPEMTDLRWLTNDAGGGICWNEYLYPGPNGPDHCRNLNTGQRVANVLTGFDRGSGARKLDVLVHANFTQAERQLIPHYVDRERVFGISPEDRIASVQPVIDNPVVGILDPVAVVAALEHAMDPQVRKICVNVGTNYCRGHELPEVAETLVGIMEEYFDAPATGTIGRLTFVRKLCARWAGPKQADELLEALIALNEAYKYKHATLPRFTGNYVGVSMRHITRPLLALPQRLSEEEEAYFLPHVFNPDLNEARMDYLDFHGGRLPTGSPAVQMPNPLLQEVRAACGRFNGVADRLANLKGKGGAVVFRDMAVSLRMFASILRSIGNFHAMQVLRDRNAERFAGSPQRPPKVASMTGDPDLLLIHDYMRDELDNTSGLADLLAGGALRRLITASRPGDVEDTFMLGADIVDQLRQKVAIMRRHWLDASEYLATPLK